MTSAEYRYRVYASYVYGRQRALAAETLGGLEPRRPYLTKLVRDHFPVAKDANIIDLGCGQGALIHFAREAGYRNIHGIDRSPQQVEAARKLGIEGVALGDLGEALAQCAADSLDLVVAFDVIEHFTREELVPFVDAVHAKLRAGGKWIIHTANGESPFCGKIRYGDLTHELAFTRTSISQLLLSSGFRKVDCFEDAPVPHGPLSLVRWILWHVIRSALRFFQAIETGAGDNDAIFSQNFLAVAVK